MSESAAPPAPAGGSTPAASSAPSSTPASKGPATEAKPNSNPLPVPNSRHVDKSPDGKTPEQTPAEVKKEIERRKYKLKVDGQESELDLTDDEITVRLQKAHAAEKRMQESAEIRKAAQQLVEDLKRDPWTVLQDPVFGVNLEEQAEQRLLEKFKADQMTEEQRRAYEAEKRLKAYEEQENRRKESEKAQKQKQMEAEIYAQEEKRFKAAADKHGLPRTLETLKAMAEVALYNHEFGIELTDDQLAMEVLAREEAPMARLKSLKGEDLLRRLPEGVADEIAKALVARFKAKQGNPQPPPVKQEAGDREDPFERKVLSQREWRKYTRDK